MFLFTIFVIKFFLDFFSFYLKTLEDKKGGKFLYSLRDNITFFIFFQFFILTSYAFKTFRFNKQGIIAAHTAVFKSKI